jgi:CheY-like chemotaxis protein
MIGRFRNCPSDTPTLLNVVEESGRELASELSTKLATDVLIIEDEVLIPIDLESLVQSLAHRLIPRTRGEAVQIARTQSPGLILADIQFADGQSAIAERVPKPWRVAEASILATPAPATPGEEALGRR